MKVNPVMIVICHGEPIVAPENTETVLTRTKVVHGFFGASSSMENLLQNGENQP